MVRNIRFLELSLTALVLVGGSAVTSDAACVPANLPTPAPRDPVARVLAQLNACPLTPSAFRNILKQSGARLEPTMVNFRGFHNPGGGAFFIFETASTTSTKPGMVAIERGDLLFGHFTRATADGRLVSNTSRLTIELIAWDPDKGFYNFYELDSGTWFYRGDSKDILDDIQLLHRARSPSAPVFGQRLRCSGCHVNGGLLQKELTEPHNDWFVEARPLPFGSLQPDAAVKEMLADLVDAKELSKLVAAFPRRLADSPGYRKVLASRSMQERLRPLFCPVEVNLESDVEPFDDRKPTVRIPSGFFVDSRLASAAVTIPRQAYDAAVKALGTTLPTPPGRPDADHAWLTPVKAHSDVVAVDALVEQGIVSREFAADVLAVDFTNPAFSNPRCGLLKLVPDKGGPDFVTRLTNALRATTGPAAAELLGNLTDPQRTAAVHEKTALAYVAKCGERASDPAAVLEWVRLLVQRRVEVSASEISQNRQGRILEDDSRRVVFPSTGVPPTPGRLALTSSCQVR